MASSINVIPPVALTPDQMNDIAQLSNLLVLISSILDNESSIVPSGNTMTPAAITSLNSTLTDASDRIDVTINPAAPLV